MTGKGLRNEQTWTRMFTAAVFGIAPNWKLKRPSMGEWLRELQRVHSYGMLHSKGKLEYWYFMNNVDESHRLNAE